MDSSLVAPRARRLLLFTAIVLSAWWALFSLPALWFPHFPAAPHPEDFAYYYDGAGVGLRWGWSHIFDAELQRRVFYSIRPATAYFDWRTLYATPPPMAWLIAPLALLPHPLAYFLWLGLNAVLFVVLGARLVPGDGWAVVAVLAGLVWLHPFMTNLQMGQNSIFVVSLVGFALLALRSGREVVAGLLCAALVLKPQVALLVPVALALWGARRAALTCLLALAGLALASALSLGRAGLAQYRDLLSLESAHAENATWSPAGLGLPPALATGLGLLLAGALLVVAWRARGGRLEIPVLAGLLASLFAFGYHHEHDYVALVLAGWLWLRLEDAPGRWPVAGVGALALALAPRTVAGPVVLFAVAWSVLLVAWSLWPSRFAPAGSVPAGLLPDARP